MTEFWAAIKHRYIYRTAAAYAVVAWLLLQLFNNLTPLLKVPDWAGTLVLVLIIGGFPVALLFAWMLDLNASSVLKKTALQPAAAIPAPGGKGPANQHTGSPAGHSHTEQPTSAPAALAARQANGPSVVVLPFANMSGEAEQDFFADGLTEDIITELSRFRHLFVISRNSAFKYKGRALNVREVARELNVHYVVEGSVRKAGSRVRVTVQLIDGQADHHIWAERYDRELQDIFAIQDEVTTAIAATVSGRVEAATGERARRKPTENMSAYECVLAGKLRHHRSTPGDNQAALQLLDRAIALDPNYAHAHAWKACVLGQAAVNGYAPDRDAIFRQAGDELQVALQLDGNDSDVHRILAAVNLIDGRHDKALYHQERALSLNPNDDLIVVQQGEILTWLGRPEQGIPWIEKAMQLNPWHPERYWNHLGRAFFVARRYAEAICAFGRITAPAPIHHAYLAACHAQLGNDTAARQQAAEVLKRDPGYSVEACLRTLHYKRPEDSAHHRAALLKAGVPERAAQVVAAS
ncbi:MAG TPA: tetratricopeptide repeat protein [Rhizomicrobium sp.]|jgi:adenylate cyclase|nr:tetratricopeptide repeat protein [Rhizomicrobium sp.]